MEATQKKNKYEIDMCNGTIMDKLISFALPLMVSSILQLLFNAVDIIVVGRFTGSQALAAVGSTTALINMFVNLFIGVSLGANVLSARFYAAGKEREMSETVHTAMTFALISGIVMVFVGLFCTRGALELMDTPADVIDQACWRGYGRQKQAICTQQNLRKRVCETKSGRLYPPPLYIGAQIRILP